MVFLFVFVYFFDTGFLNVAQDSHTYFLSTEITCIPCLICPEHFCVCVFLGPFYISVAKCLSLETSYRKVIFWDPGLENSRLKLCYMFGFSELLLLEVIHGGGCKQGKLHTQNMDSKGMPNSLIVTNSSATNRVPFHSWAWNLCNLATHCKTPFSLSSTSKPLSNLWTFGEQAVSQPQPTS